MSGETKIIQREFMQGGQTSPNTSATTCRHRHRPRSSSTALVGRPLQAAERDPLDAVLGGVRDQPVRVPPAACASVAGTARPAGRPRAVGPAVAPVAAAAPWSARRPRRRRAIAGSPRHRAGHRAGGPAESARVASTADSSAHFSYASGYAERCTALRRVGDPHVLPALDLLQRGVELAGRVPRVADLLRRAPALAGPLLEQAERVAVAVARGSPASTPAARWRARSPRPRSGIVAPDADRGDGRRVGHLVGVEGDLAVGRATVQSRAELGAACIVPEQSCDRRRRRRCRRPRRGRRSPRSPRSAPLRTRHLRLCEP